MHHWIRACSFDQQLSDDGDAAERFLGGTPKSHPLRYQSASPAAQLPLGCPQLLVSGTEDTDVPHALTQEYAEEARKSGDSVW